MLRGLFATLCKYAFSRGGPGALAHCLVALELVATSSRATALPNPSYARTRRTSAGTGPHRVCQGPRPHVPGHGYHACGPGPKQLPRYWPSRKPVLKDRPLHHLVQDGEEGPAVLSRPGSPFRQPDATSRPRRLHHCLARARALKKGSWDLDLESQRDRRRHVTAGSTHVGHSSPGSGARPLDGRSH